MTAAFIPRLLSQLRDVQINTPSNGEVMTWETATSKWKNKPPGSVVSNSLGIFNVLDYGAEGDGLTNDTLAIQAAIDAASAAATTAGGNARATVLIPGGRTYKLAFRNALGDPGYLSALLMKSNVELIGYGRPRLLCNMVGVSHGPPGSQSIITGLSGGLANPISNVAIRGLVFDGGFVSNQQSAGLAFPNATEDFYGINIAYVNGIEITDNYLVGVFGDAIRVGDGSVTDLLAARNYVTIFNGQAINVLNGNRARVTGNYCYDSQSTAGGSTETIACDSVAGPMIVDHNFVLKAGTCEITTVTASNAYIAFVGNYVAPLPGSVAAMQVRNGTASGNIIDMETYGGSSPSGSRAISPIDSVVEGNRIFMHPTPGGTMYGIADANGDMGNSTITGNVITVSSGSSNSNVDIFTNGAGNTVITGNSLLSAKGALSVYVKSATLFFANNICGRALQHDGSDSTSAIITGNRFVSNPGNAFNNGLYLAGSNSIVSGNYIDATAATSAAAIALSGGGSAGGHQIRGNVIQTASGVAALSTGGGRANGDVWDSNTILGAGTLTLASNQYFRRGSGGRVDLTYGATINTDLTLADFYVIVVTDANNFTIANPTKGQPGQRFVYDVLNSSGGAMGTITWGGNFRLAGSFTNPANGKRRTVEFVVESTGAFIEVNRAAADI